MKHNSHKPLKTNDPTQFESMKTLKFSGLHHKSSIIIGAGLNDLTRILPHNNVFIITDNNVHDAHKASFPDFPVFIMKAGELSKTAGTAYQVCQWLIEAGAGRDAFLLGIGGGVVCDMTGFVASIYMRGISFGFVATSLMAQVDAAIGGKNGVNLEGYKNMIGTFNQPQFVLCDPGILKTLPDKELKNGLAEVVKHCLIADKNMFYMMAEQTETILTFEKNIIHQLIEHSISTKLDIVTRDEFEQGERRKLNLGHTWGHGVEKIDGIPHGQAVSVGLVFAARMSEKKGLLTSQETQCIIDLLKKLGLPAETNTNPEIIYDAIIKDKKKKNDQIHFVFMDGIGSVKVELVKYDELREL